MAKYLDHDGVAYLWSKIKATFAPLASPTFTGTPVAPTATTGDNSTQIATTAFVQNTVSSVTSGVSGVKGDAESTYRTGNVNLTPANIGAMDGLRINGTKVTVSTQETNIMPGDGIDFTLENDSPYRNFIIGEQFPVYYGTCSTAAATAAKDVVCSGFSLATGATIIVKFSNGNTTATSRTLNVNSTGAKPIGNYRHWTSGATLAFTYDGTNWNLHDPNYDIDTKTTAGSSNSTSKLFLVGTTTQSSAGTTSYSNTKVYATDGALVADTFNGYTLGAASEKTIGSVANGNTGLVTGGDVYTAIQSAVAGSMTYQGTVTSDAGLGTTYKAGYYWIVGNVTTDPQTTIAGYVVEPGDMLIAHADYSGTLASDIDCVQNNIQRITNGEIDAIIAAA